MDINTNDLIDKDILELLGIENMPADKKEEFYNKMLQTIHLRVLARIDEKLTDEEASAWKQIADSKDSVAYQKFLTDHEINIEELYALESLIFKAELVELANVSSKPVAQQKDQAHV